MTATCTQTGKSRHCSSKRYIFRCSPAKKDYTLAASSTGGETMAVYQHDVLIVGSGAAGLTVALHLPANTSVGVLSKGALTSASTFYAQGGVAAVLDKADSLESHIHDTHV